jgi:enamine deaminase RidA (YjgF/YER057c/UK114 family)
MMASPAEVRHQSSGDQSPRQQVNCMEIEEAYASTCQSPPPTRSTPVASALPMPQALISIEAIAMEATS